MVKAIRPLGVLIVDDEMFFCDIARELLRKSSQFAVVGETYDAQQAMELIDELKPDVILMDVEMEGINGLEATHLIRKRFPKVPVVLTSIYDEKEYSRQAIKVGALAFIPKKDFSAPALARILDREATPQYDP